MTRRILLQTALIFAKPASADTRDIARRVFERANELRVASGVHGLAWWDPLSRCARDQSVRKARLRFEGHTDPERGTLAQRIQAAGISWQRCGENLFEERGYPDPVRSAIAGWWHSPGHKANMLNPAFTETGVGVALGDDDTYFVTQIFLLPPPRGR